MQIKNLIIPIDKKIVIKYEDKDFKLKEEVQKQINEYWDKLNNKFRRGRMYTVTDIKNTENSIEFQICNTDYAHYIYGRYNQIDEKVACKNLWAGIILETSDKKYVLGEMSEITASEGELHVSGGGLDKEDIENGIVNIEKTMIRELKEEFNIDITDYKIAKYYKPKFYKIPSKLEEYSVGILYKGKLKISSKEFEENYEKYVKYLKETNGEIEFKSILFVDKNERNIKKFFKKYGDKSQEFNEDMFIQDIHIT